MYYFFIGKYKFFLDPILLGDFIDKLIASRDVNALRKIVLNGEYNVSNLANRIYPPESQDLSAIMFNLYVIFFLN